jgi:hypothetical protein
MSSFFILYWSKVLNLLPLLAMFPLIRLVIWHLLCRLSTP